MEAAAVDRYGPPDNVVVREVATPRPRRGEVLVRVDAVAVTAGDARIRAARFPPGFTALGRLALGLRGPRRAVLGSALSGTVEALGEGVDALAAGDVVAGMTGTRLGGHAQYAVARADSLSRRPEGVSAADAAAVLFGGGTALHFLRDRVHPGSSVLVNGASGSVGSAAVQLAVLAGGEVTAVCSGRNAALVSRLGATHVVDHTTTSLASLPAVHDVVLDAVGNVGRADGLRLLRADGVLVLAAAGLLDTVRAGRGRGRVVAGPAPERAEAHAHLLDLVAAGRLDPLTEVVGGLGAVVEAHRRVDTGRKVGNLVVAPWA